MSDLIRRTDVIDFLEQHRQSILIGSAGYTDANEIADTIEVFKTILSSPLTIKSVPVVHGEWEMRGGRLYCTNCGKKALEEKDRDDWYGCVRSNFCPNCGADMRTSAE